MNETQTVDTAAQATPPVDIMDMIQVGQDAVESAKTTYLTDPQLLTIDFSLNGRFDEPEAKKVKAYAQGFADPAIGQLQPIRCKKVKGGLLVTYGFHRALAGVYGIQHGLLPDDWKIRYELDESADAKDSFLKNVAENQQQAPLTFMDKAVNYVKMTTEFGMSPAEASERLGHKARFGNAVEHIMTLPKKVHKRIHAGDISGELAYEVAMAGERGLNVLLKMLDKSATGKVLRHDWQEAMREDKEANYTESNGGVGDDVTGEGEVGADRKKKKKKKGAVDRTAQRTLKQVNEILDEVIALGKDAPGFAVAKKLRDINSGKGSAKAAVKYIQTLTASA
jgi:hypothetical protein